MPLTPRGAPYPGDGPGVPNDVPGDMKKLAEWSDARPGISPMSSTSRAALSGIQLWEGRVVEETNTGRLLAYIGGEWRRIALESTLGGEWETTTMVLTGAAALLFDPVVRMRRVGNTVTVRAQYIDLYRSTSTAGPILFNLPPEAPTAFAGFPFMQAAGHYILGSASPTATLRPVWLVDNKLRIELPAGAGGAVGLNVEYEAV